MKITLWAEENLSLATDFMFSSIEGQDYNVQNIVIVPDRFSLLAEKQLLEKSPENILFNVKVTNFSSFTTFLLDGLGKSGEMASAGERILILQRAVNKVKDKFVFFKKSNINFCSQLFKSISLLESSRVFPSDIENQTFNLESTQSKYHDILLVYKEYISMLGERLDPALLFEKLLQEDGLEKILANKKIYIAQFDSFTSQMYEVLKLFALKAMELNVSMAHSQSIGNGYIYENDLEQKLLQIAKQNNIQIDVKVGNLDKSLKQKTILRNLFSCQMEKSAERGGYKSFKAYSKRDEIDFVAKKISKKVQQGYNFSSFAVALADIEKYRVDIEEIFDKYNIRYFIDYSKNAFDTVIVRALASLLSVSTQNFSKDAVVNFLTNPLISRVEDNSEKVEEILQKNLDGRWKYDKFFDFSSKIMQILQNFDKSQSNKQMIEQVKNFLDTLSASYEEYLLSLEEKGLYQEQSIEGQGKEELEKALSLIESNLDLNEKCDKREFVKELELILSAKELSSVPSYLNAVMIGDATDSFFEKRKCLFVLGGQDLPKVIGDNAILSDREIENPIYKKVVSPTSRMINRRNRFALFNLLSEGWEEIYLLYLAILEDGKATIEPAYIKQLDEMFEEQCANIYNYFQPKTDEEWALYFGNKSNFESYLIENERKTEDKLNISPEKNKKLFFKNDYFSVTQLETFFSCPFKHFARYGLKLKENDRFEFDGRDSGNICHKAVELFVAQFLNKNFCYQYGMIDNFIEQNFDKIIEETGTKQKLELMSEQEGMKKFLKMQIKTILKNVCFDLENSLFVPALIEERVEKEVDGLRFAGKVDRVDVGKDYFRIIDYKTGKPKSVVKDLYYGDKLQLFLYSVVIGEKINKNCGGVFYFDCHFDFEENESAKSILKGLAENDDENLQLYDKNISKNGKSMILQLALSKSKGKTFVGKAISKKPLAFYQQYALALAESSLKDIQNGYIEAKPDANSCRNCQYSAICGYRKEMGTRIKNFSEKLFGE